MHLNKKNYTYVSFILCSLHTFFHQKKRIFKMRLGSLTNVLIDSKVITDCQIT